jgi:hypothetical protein
MNKDRIPKALNIVTEMKIQIKDGKYDIYKEGKHGKKLRSCQNTSGRRREDKQRHRITCAYVKVECDYKPVCYFSILSHC